VLAACAPDVPQQQPPGAVTTAVFDPTHGQIPQPNDLALQPPSSGTPALPAAQQELLNVFAANGGFPNDQEVPVTISFQRGANNADGSVTYTAPDLDLTTLTPSTLLVFLNNGAGAGPVALDPVQAADYVKAADRGTLTLHHQGRLPWAPGRHMVALRGGPNGVKTAAGDAIYASQTFYFIAQGQDLTTEQNLALLRAQAGSTAAALALANQLNAVITLYKSGGVFDAVNRVFPQQELAALTTFAIAPLRTQVQLDPNRGLVPLPIDLLRDPRPPSQSCAACGKLTPIAACTLAQGTFNAATGACSSPAAAGFAALDGFSTTGFILAPTSDLLQVSTISTANVQLYDLSSPAAPALVDKSTYITEPVEVTQSGLSPVIALQPAGATGGDTSSVFRTRPLKENTMYAVVIGDGVKDKTGASLARGTVASIVQLANPVVDVSGHSQLAGVDDPTAGALEVMRQQLVPVLATAASNGIASGHVAMAYTFKTQSFLKLAVNLGALPYTQLPNTGAPGAIANRTPAAAFAKYGVSGDVSPTAGPVPSTHINEILETTITTFNLLDPATGAFNAAGTTANETINVLIATPKLAAVPACTGSLTGLACSPMVIFRHGLGGGRAQMLTVADSFAAKGFTVVAIDAAKHGDRSFCTSGATTISVGGVTVPQCVGATCTTQLPPGAQGDTAPPGTCPGSFFYRPVSGACQASPAGCGWTGTEGIPVVSANYLVSANFFRTRDTTRQDIIDEAQLVRAIAFVPTGAPPTGHPLFDYMAGQGVIIDPAKTYFIGQSLGAIQGTLDVATNPRISRAVLNVGGGTTTDIFANSPAFVAVTNALLATLGIQPGANSAYLQFLVVAKTILDPADPVNYAGHITKDTLPNLLPPLGGNTDGSVPQQPKGLLTQAAYCDQVVPNPFNYILDSNAACGSTLFPCAANPFASGFRTSTGTFELFYKGGTSATANFTTCPAPPAAGGSTPGAVSHGFLTEWGDIAATARAQADAAAFLFDGTQPSSLTVIP
jgi:hypothetical protein